MCVKFSEEFWDNLLKPCPFCGGQAFIMSGDKKFLQKLDANEPHVEYPPEKGPYYIACDKCETESKTWPELEDAIKAWNTRYAEGTAKHYILKFEEVKE